ncbi:filamentous hemagglutinin N-terminal domain-containing protein [Cronobacter turicensis]|uniref:filamentous hemagglutinin N-terminal domain-containing protein n=1 Tax=Cronobacter turicensis TaxID=413502 RepID=UPI0024C3629F|nr:filamentous hemagglutinin N-terminal domain-containing protein [Cronobacter turicensis]MDK1183093.1 filamentous hemagglutinin N-terminal domain-containing protein [Cronobacter turicensis]MDK1205400.1 filamentous hemagglutinin N-terminal domain-containing protein [Cronobacter turicensis]MDK1215139.1 filamentous hemagglutinin N-terminal domain-containing protein [Cronobacter turicensis]MDK1219230.1 filamentous hemagglutinin N-terminal domain-containing protein [Cronobacter turicensis]MDK12315
MKMSVSSPRYRISALCFSTWIALGLVSQAHAAIVVDQQKSPTTTVNVAGNGATVVDVSAPSNGGVSHNYYKQFDVNSAGVVLNNGAGSSNTTLAGNVNGNANMSGGSASVILNEVASSNPSQLNGMVEVAGQQAAVIIANPSGITCDGCGFINTSRSTLVTGSVDMTGGKVSGFNVTDGKIVITGKGMDDHATDYTDIISRSVVVNAQLTARDLRIVTGSNKVNYKTLDAREIKPAKFSPQPSLALDVSSLGGMYANKIELIGTEDGVGVRNNGIISTAAESISITLDGELENNNIISANKDLLIDTNQHAVDNDHGTLQAERDLAIASSKLDNNTNGLITAENININTHGGTLDNNGKGIIAREDISVSAGDIDNGSRLTGGGVMTISADKLSNRGEISADTLSVAAHKITNQNEIQVQNTLTISSDTLENEKDGLISSAGDMALQTHDIRNRGKIYAQDTLDAYASHSLDNEQGVLGAVGNVTVDTKTLTNTAGAIFSARQLDIVADTIDNSADMCDGGGTIAGNTISMSSGYFNNDKGTLKGNTVYLQGDTFDVGNGTISATGNITVNADKDFYVNNHGAVESRGGDITINAADNFSNDGTIKGTGAITLNSSTFSNKGSISTGDDITIYAAKSFVNENGGYINGRDGLSIEAVNTLDNDGSLYSYDTITLRSHRVTNHKGAKISSDDNEIFTDRFVNHGRIEGYYDLHDY